MCCVPEMQSCGTVKTVPYNKSLREGRANKVSLLPLEHCKIAFVGYAVFLIELLIVALMKL